MEPIRFPFGIDDQLRLINAKFLERPNGTSTGDATISCFRDSYDVFAKEKGLLLLNHFALNRDIPAQVLLASLKFGWVRVHAGTAMIQANDAGHDIWIAPVGDAPAGTTHVMGVEISTSFWAWFLSALRGRIEYWSARRFAEPGDQLSLRIDSLLNDTDGTPRTPLPAPSVSEQLRKLRLEAGITEQALSDEMMIDLRTTQRHLSGAMEPRQRTLAQYSSVFSKLLKRRVVIRQNAVKRRNAFFANAVARAAT